MTDITDPAKAIQILDSIRTFREQNKLSPQTTHTMPIEDYSLIHKVLGLYYTKYTIEVNEFIFKITIPTNQ